jgi:hypothetical protein
MTSLKDRTKFSTSSFDADKVKIETKEKVNGKEKLIYVNLIDKDSGKYIAFETLEPLFTPFGATSSKDYPDSYSITFSFRDSNEKESHFFEELMKLKEKILDHIEKDSKTIFKKKMTKEVMLTADKFKSAVGTIVSKTNGNSYNQVAVKISTSKEGNKPQNFDLFTMKDKKIKQINLKSMSKVDAWNKVKNTVSARSEVRAVFIPMVDLRNGNAKFTFNALQVLADEPTENEPGSVFGFTCAEGETFDNSASKEPESQDAEQSAEDTEDEEEIEEEEEEDEEDD